MASPCIGFEIGLGHICWYFRAYICSKILKVLHPCIGFGIGLGHIWGHANAWIWYIHAYAWILYIHVLSHISHIPKAEIFGFMFQYLSSERMGLRFWANPIHNTWLDHGEISRTRCTPNRPAVFILKKECQAICNWMLCWFRLDRKEESSLRGKAFSSKRGNHSSRRPSKFVTLKIFIEKRSCSALDIFFQVSVDTDC